MCDQRQAICMPLNGKVQCIDGCIHHIVAALNAGGVWTVGSCCGHDGKPLPMGRIDLEDGRVLLVASKEQADTLCSVVGTAPAGRVHDSDRLDWLESRAGGVQSVYFNDGRTVLSPLSMSLRAAIDASRVSAAAPKEQGYLPSPPTAEDHNG